MKRTPTKQAPMKRAKPDADLTNAILKACDKYREEKPEESVSTMLASLAVAFEMIFKLLPRAVKHRNKSDTGYSVVATIPEVKLERVPA